MHQEEWSKRDFGGDYQPATGEAEQITQTRHGAQDLKKAFNGQIDIAEQITQTRHGAQDLKKNLKKNGF